MLDKRLLKIYMISALSALTFFCLISIIRCPASVFAEYDYDITAPVAAVVWQSPNDTYSKTKSAELSFEDNAGEPGTNSGIYDVTMDGVSA